MFDIHGNEILIGHRIVWPCRTGSKTYLKSGVVETVGRAMIRCRNEKGRAVVVRRIDRVAVCK